MSTTGELHRWEERLAQLSARQPIEPASLKPGKPRLLRDDPVAWAAFLKRVEARDKKTQENIRLNRELAAQGKFIGPKY